jgi:hypothetical protein
MPDQAVKEEVEAIAVIYHAIQPFNSKARTRILDWIVAKLEEDRDKELGPQQLSTQRQQ